MEMNPVEPMAQLNAILGEIVKMPLGPERDKKWEEAYALFEPAAEELSILGGQIRVLAERNQNGETLKAFMKNSGITTPVAIIRPVKKKHKFSDALKLSAKSVGNLWDRKKGKIAIGMTLVAALFFWANQRNIKMLDDFTHDNDLVGLFEDWLQITDEGERETPLDWKETEGPKNA